jgi:protein-tyrosine phosphatase
MAEGILRARAAAAALDVHIHSAGILHGGAPATDNAIAVCAERGIDITGHVSRRIEPSMVEAADLIIAMTREHLREAVVASPEAFSRTFTLRELVRRINERPNATLAELHAGRDLERYVKADKADDVADPVRKPLAAYQDTALELDGLLARLVLWLPNLSSDTREQAAS